MNANLIKLGLLEFFILLGTAISLVVLCFFAPDYSIIVTALLALVFAWCFSQSCVESEKIVSKLPTFIVALVVSSVAWSISLFASESELSRGNIESVGIPIVVGFFMTVIMRIFIGKLRENLVRVLIVDTTLTVLMSFVPFFYQELCLYGGYYKALVIMTFAPLVVVAIISLILTIIDHFTQDGRISTKLRVQCSVIGGAVTVIIIHQVLNSYFEFIALRSSDIFIAIFILFVTLTISNNYFHNKHDYNNAVLIALAPIILGFPLLYLSSVLVQA
jgi:Na+/glutamate symporter